MSDLMMMDKLKFLEEENAKLKEENDNLFKTLIKCRAVIEDFMPNIGQCVLQDYQQLNEALCESALILEGDK